MSVQYTKAILELRQMLMDTDTNKSSHHKKLIGAVDGVNIHFITYDKKLFPDTVEVFVEHEPVDFEIIDPIAGLIDLSSAPQINQHVTYSCYWQFFTDSELKNFLNKGAETCGLFVNDTPDDAYLQIPGGLKTPALYFAIHTALNAQVNYMVNRRHSEEFNLEQDGNDDEGFSKMIDALQKQAMNYFKNGMLLRDDFFKGQGARFRPAFGIKKGTTRQYGPKR